MKINSVLYKVYATSSSIVCSVLLFICVVLGYDWILIASILLLALVMSAPPVILLHLVFFIIQKIRLTKIAAWIALLAAIPLLSLVPALMFDAIIPGDTIVLVALGMLSSYGGVLIQGISISELINDSVYETE